MSEELWLALTGSVEPSLCFGGLASQSFELLYRPSDEVFVDARCDGIQLGAVEGSVVVELSMASGICPVADSRTARSWPTELPGGGQVFCP